MEKVLGEIDFEQHALKPVYKAWDTKDASDVEIKDDYVYRYLFASEAGPLVVYVSLSGEELEVEFYYDLNNTAFEKWVLETNHKLALPRSKSPTFGFLPAMVTKRRIFTPRKSKPKTLKSWISRAITTMILSR
ncbi:MAG: hypothetical protein R3B47_06235 [Bacteroidia bacterium]